MNKRQGHPFILIKHLRVVAPPATGCFSDTYRNISLEKLHIITFLRDFNCFCFAGSVILHSVCDATKVVTDINIQEVMDKRAQLMSV